MPELSTALTIPFAHITVCYDYTKLTVDHFLVLLPTLFRELNNYLLQLQIQGEDLSQIQHLQFSGDRLADLRLTEFNDHHCDADNLTIPFLKFCKQVSLPDQELLKSFFTK